MRTLIYSLTFIIGSIFNSIVAQNFRTLPLLVKEHYYKDSVGYVFPIEPDSIKISNGDTTYFHFKSIRIANTTITIDYYYPPFFNLKGDSWAGRKTIIKANGDNIWFASKGDSILVKPLTTINGIWLVSGKYNLYGTVSGIDLKTFCGIADTVKTLSIGKYSFELSKNYGFIKMPDIYNFYTTSMGVDYPFSGPKSDVELYGSNLIKGTKTKLTDSLAYNFEEGDEIDYNIDTTKVYYNGVKQIITSSKIKIIAKSISEIDKKILLTTQKCGNTASSSNWGNEGYKLNAINTFSGQNVIYFTLLSQNEPPFKVKNDQDFVSIGYMLFFNDYDLLEQKNLSDDEEERFYSSINDSTYYELFSDNEGGDVPGSIHITKIEGLGEFRAQRTFNSSFLSLKNGFTESLHYYKGHLGTFGTNPYSCDSLIAQYTLATADEIKTKITPISPFDAYLKINTIQKLKQIRITDMLGIAKIEQQNLMNSEQVYINTQSLNEGLYLLQVTDVLGNRFSFKVLKE